MRRSYCVEDEVFVMTKKDSIKLISTEIISSQSNHVNPHPPSTTGIRPTHQRSQRAFQSQIKAGRWGSPAGLFCVAPACGWRSGSGRLATGREVLGSLAARPPREDRSGGSPDGEAVHAQ